MKIAVLGAGAVGCYYGGMLARAGHEVLLVGRAGHVDAVRREGLLLQTSALRERVPLDASVDAGDVRGAELVLFCVKSSDTEQAGTELARSVDARTLVLSLQNGVDNAARLQALLPCTVAPAVVYVAAEMAGPGHVLHHGRGDLVLGPAPAGGQCADLFRAAAIPVQISENVAGALWAKLAINCAYNALSAIARLPYGRLVQGEGVQQLMDDVVQECLAVARAEGVHVPGDIAYEVRAIGTSMPGQHSSTAQDLARGKRSEIDHLNGYVARRGRALGIAVPLNRTLQVLVKLLETPMGTTDIA
jgi:2-dehydropantoate 2-reductase